MEFTEENIAKYAKKIMGFAWSKTKNPTQAEDLSQEIMLALTKALRRQKIVTDLDGFVFKISQYTWSNYLRANKKHWNNLDLDKLEEIQDNREEAEEDDERLNLMQRLKEQLAYLNNLHREIVLMFYFENKRGREISEALGLPDSTIRWHLGQIKQKLRKEIEMETQNELKYRPRRLIVGHDGWTKDMDMHGLASNPLVQNICIALYGQKLTIDELSKTLQVAAAYVEPLANDLLSMDYLRKDAKNRYSTNFYIRTKRMELCIAKFHYHNVGEYAEKIYQALNKRFNAIKSIGFCGCDLDRDFLLWALIPLLNQDFYYRSLERALEEKGVVLEAPLRKDGTRHWVSANYADEPMPDGFTAEEIDFLGKSKGHGVKTRGSDTGEKALQYDSYATIKAGINWREFGSNDELRLFLRIAELCKSGEELNYYEKNAAVSLVEQGYLKFEDKRPILLIPVLNLQEKEGLNVIFQEIYNELGETMLTDYILKFAEYIESEIPRFIGEDEKNYLRFAAYPQYAILYWLQDNGFLRVPTDEEAKRLCSVVWKEG